MASLDVSVKASKELHELVSALCEVALVVKSAVAGGASLVELPAHVLPLLGGLKDAVEGVGKIGDEAKEDLGATLMAVAAPLAAALPKLLAK